MNMSRASILCGVGLLLASGNLFGQRAVVDTKSVAKTQAAILAIKQRAEAGSIPAQIALGNKFVEYRRSADALIWYRKAADKGSVEGEYYLGNMLLNGEIGSTADQSVVANPIEGLTHTYRAATNSHPLACRNLSQALQKGLGTKTNFVEAYAWLQLCADRNPLLVRAELENLALRMPTRDLQEGQKLYKQFKNHQWPDPFPRAVAKAAQVVPVLDLKLDGISLGARSPLATINRRTVAVGEVAEITLKGRTVEIKCLKIEDDSVSILVTGETEPRILRFGERSPTVGLR